MNPGVSLEMGRGGGNQLYILPKFPKKLYKIVKISVHRVVAWKGEGWYPANATNQRHNLGHPTKQQIYFFMSHFYFYVIFCPKIQKITKYNGIANTILQDLIPGIHSEIKLFL